MRVLFAGSPALAVPSLEEVARAGEISAVLTGRDQPAGRGQKRRPTPVKARALELALRTIEADRVDSAVEEAVKELAPELLVVVAFGRIFRKSFLDLFPRGGINLHPSLLPKFRGPSPISAVILAGECETGVTVQRLAPRFDSGDILAQKTCPLDGSETTGTLTERLAPVGAELLASVLTRMREAEVPGRPQREEDATYCRLVRKEDGRIDWSAPAKVIERMVRGYDPWPRARTTFAGQGLLVLKSRCLPDTLGEISATAGGAHPPGTIIGSSPQSGLLVRAGHGILAVERLQLQFKKPLDWRSFLNGHPDAIGTRLGG